MSEMFSITRASLRMGRAAWQCSLPSGAKLVLLCILHHYNDARGMAFPSVGRVARLCGLHKRTVQSHIAQLEKMGVLQVGKMPGISTHVYRVNEEALAPTLAENLSTEVVFSAPKGGDFSASSAEIATQNGLNAFEPTKITEASAPVPEPAPVVQPAVLSSSSSSSLFLAALQNPEDQSALEAWQQVRHAKKRPALPNALQCQQLLDHAASLGKPLGWVVQVMALNDWAGFDPAWLNNQRPPPRLPVVATLAASSSQAPATPPYQPPAPVYPPVSAEESAQAKARLFGLLEQWRGPEPTQWEPIQPCGVAWADNIIARALRGEPVGFTALDMACAVAKVSRRAVRAAAKAQKAALE
ncbi:MAG: helix-turn-helix domain-containing protein [Giesbergeria sp.]|uniref:helix-turn-helix domain-containing protein n=1 Tax=Giesbergeria sp. TaxID=2818473 RepID=UPI00261AEC11|nr:helix-turn-helix domain-containing protein [Giesbergeria sp.]MDD2609978.1 helix-turn-helix domain-containing protein [Giesbergeria sp.]